MHVYHDANDEDDYIGIAASGPVVLLVVHEADSNDGFADAAELELTSPNARAIAEKLRELLDGNGKATEVAGVFLGRTSDEPGILVSVGVDGGTSRSVIVSRADAADFAERLTLAASEVTEERPDGTANQGAQFADLIRRAAALKITAGVFDVAEVDLFDAAEWVATAAASEAE